MIKGVIFDLDGVIVSTDKYHYLAWKKIADEENIYFDEIINNRLRGVSRMESLEIILEKANKKYNNEEKLILASKKNEIYKESLKELTRKDVNIEVIETLDYLKEKGIKMAIGSSSRNTMLILSSIELLDYFDEIVDGNQISKSKPDPEVFVKACDKLKLLKEECIVVEDAVSGVLAAINGGFKVCGINDARKFEKTTYSIDNLKDILKYII